MRAMLSATPSIQMNPRTRRHAGMPPLTLKAWSTGLPLRLFARQLVSQEPARCGSRRRDPVCVRQLGQDPRARKDPQRAGSARDEESCMIAGSPSPRAASRSVKACRNGRPITKRPAGPWSLQRLPTAAPALSSGSVRGPGSRQQEAQPAASTRWTRRHRSVARGVK